MKLKVNSISFFRTLFSCTLFAILCAGCGKTDVDFGFEVVPASGVVISNGQPVAGAAVSFIPEQTTTAGYYGSGAITDEEGKFTLTIGSKAGAMPGSYRVTVSKLMTEQGTPLNTATLEEGMDVEQLKLQGAVQESIPDKFSNSSKTVLKIEVPTAGKEDMKIELDS